MSLRKVGDKSYRSANNIKTEKYIKKEIIKQVFAGLILTVLYKIYTHITCYAFVTFKNEQERKCNSRAT